MPQIVHIIGYALLFSVPVIALGAAALVAARRASLTVSMVLLVLIPTAATLSGVVGVSGFMFTDSFFGTVAVVATVAVIAVPAAVVLGRYQARRTVWERQARERERAVESSRRELVAWISHDLRTPLADVLASAEALRDAVVTEPGEVHAYSEEIVGAATRLGVMVDDLFAMSRITAGTLEITRERLDLREIADEVVAASRSAAERAGVELDVRTAADPVPVAGSPAALTRAVTNLVDNALTHTPVGGTVAVATGADDGVGWLRVDDTGDGIDAADLPRIFEPAYRGVAARSVPVRAGRGPGAGMGLAIAAGLVEAHDGVVTAHNRTRGARFEIRLPAVGPE